MTDSSAFDLSHLVGQTGTLTFSDGTTVTAKLLHCTLDRDIRQAHPDPLLNIDGPALDPHPVWVLGPTRATLTLEAHEGDQHGPTGT